MGGSGQIPVQAGIEEYKGNLSVLHNKVRAVWLGQVRQAEPGCEGPVRLWEEMHIWRKENCRSESGSAQTLEAQPRGAL